MEAKPHISIVLDSRREKADGKFPVKLRVFTSAPRIQKLYPLPFSYTKKEFQGIWESQKPRKEFKQSRLELQAIENLAAEAVRQSSPFTFEGFEKKLSIKKGQGENLIHHYTTLIENLNSKNQFGTANNYKLSLRSLLNFANSKGRKTEFIHFSTITPEWLEKYEQFMVEVNQRSLTTVSMYLRALRTIFNNAISAKDINIELYPFGKRKYQIPAVRNVKKSLSKDQLKTLFNAIAKTEEQQKAKDFWFFSFNCNGINLKDIALLRYENLHGDKIIFYRAKTMKTAKSDLKPVTVYLNEFSKSVIEKYGNVDKSSTNLIFPILSDNKPTYENFRNVKNFIISMNKNLKKLAKAEGIEGSLSTYWARHSFATTAIRNGASMEFVSEALSHNNLKTTQNYFAGFEEDSKRELMQNLMNF